MNAEESRNIREVAIKGLLDRADTPASEIRPSTLFLQKTKARLKPWAKVLLSALKLIPIALIMTSLQVRNDQSFARLNLNSQHWVKTDVFWYWQHRLPDLAMDYLEQFGWYWGLPVQAADWALNSLVGIGILFAFLNGIGSACLVIWLEIMTICYGLRLLAMPLTPLPPSDSRCPLSPNLTGIPLYGYLSRGLGVWLGSYRTCTDKLFSGHTSAGLAILYLFWLHSDSHGLAFTYATLHYALVLFLIVACRNHYTVDVVLGLIVSGLVIALYELSRRRKKRALTRSNPNAFTRVQ